MSTKFSKGCVKHDTWMKCKTQWKFLSKKVFCYCCM